MQPLTEDLQSHKTSLTDFCRVAKRVLDYLPVIISEKVTAKNYIIASSKVAGTLKYARPIKRDLFLFESDDFDKKNKEFLSILKKIRNRNSVTSSELNIIDSVVYTMQQSIGVGMDFLCNPNSARKHVGNRFEELIRLIIMEIGVSSDNIVFKIPYPSEDGEKMYSCETDIVLSPHDPIKSNTTTIDPDEIVVSLKTTSKDRMGKIFLDKILMQKFAGHPVKVVGIFLNDIQRKEKNKTSYTFVSGLFMVYTKFLDNLEGVYFIDPPPITNKPPYNQHVFKFSKFIAEDIWNLLAP